jgi:hypothetical protein
LRQRFPGLMSAHETSLRIQDERETGNRIERVLFTFFGLPPPRRQRRRRCKKSDKNDRSLETERTDLQHHGDKDETEDTSMEEDEPESCGYSDSNGYDEDDDGMVYDEDLDEIVAKPTKYGKWFRKLRRDQEDEGVF